MAALARTALVSACLTWYGWQTVTYLPAWRSDVTLWTHAAQMAPQKPRVALNYGVVLLAQGDLGGLEQFARAQALTQQAHVPASDAQMTRARVEANIQRIIEAAR